MTGLTLIGISSYFVENASSAGGFVFTPVTTDNFNRANETPIGVHWYRNYAATNFNLSASTVVANALGNDTEWSYTTTAFANDQYAQAAITVSSASAGAGYGVSTRNGTLVLNPDTKYRCVVSKAASNNIELGVRNSSAVYSTLMTLTSAWNDGDILRLASVSTTHYVYRNGTLLGSTTNALLTAGRPGMTYSSTVDSGNIDSWEGGDVT